MVRFTLIQVSRHCDTLQGQELTPDFQASSFLAQSQHHTQGPLHAQPAQLARKNLDFVTQKMPELINLTLGLAMVETS